MKRKEQTIGFEIKGYFEPDSYPLEWKNFRDALAALDWAFFGETQDLPSGSLYIHGQFYHETSTFILTNQSLALLEHELNALFKGKASNIPLEPYLEEVKV